MKKTFLILAVLCCTMLVKANGTRIEYETGKFMYFILNNNDHTASVTYKSLYDQSEYTGDIVIPSSITYGNTQYAVTSIGNDAFVHCQSLSSISIPNSVTSIGNNAFYDCQNLSSISLPSGLTSIGYDAFENCTILSSVSLPSGLTSIDERAFVGCTSLSLIAVFAPNPPALGTDAFFSIHPHITVRVPNGETDSYRSAWESYFYPFTPFEELTTDDYRQQALCEINRAMQGLELTTEEQAAINACIQTINDAEDITAIENAKEAALTLLTKVEALAAIEAAMQGETSTYLTGLVQQYIGIINSATDVTAINNAKETALTAVTAYKAGKAEGLGEMGTECEDCHAVEVKKGDKTIILYNPESVTFKKAE